MLDTWLDLHLSKYSTEEVLPSPSLTQPSKTFNSFKQKHSQSSKELPNLEDPKANQTSRKGFLINIEIILEFTLRELIKQVKVTCEDRGKLLEKVISLLVSLQLDNIELAIKEKNQYKLRTFKKLFSIQESKDYEVKELNALNSTLQCKVDSFQSEYRKIEDQLEQLKNKYLKVRQKKKDLKGMTNMLIDNLFMKETQLKNTKEHQFQLYNQSDGDESGEESKSSLRDKTLLPNTIQISSFKKESMARMNSPGKIAGAMASHATKHLFKNPKEGQSLMEHELKRRISSRFNKLLVEQVQSKGVIKKAGLMLEIASRRKQSHMLRSSEYSFSKDDTSNQSPTLKGQRKFSEQNSSSLNLKIVQEAKEETKKVEDDASDDENEQPQQYFDRMSLKKKLKLENLHLEIKQESDTNTERQTQMDRTGTNRANQIQISNFDSAVQKIPDTHEKQQTENQQAEPINQDEKVKEKDKKSSSSSSSSSSAEEIELFNRSMQFPEDDLLSKSDFLDPPSPPKSISPKRQQKAGANVVVLKPGSQDMKNGNKKRFTKVQKKESIVDLDSPLKKSIEINFNFGQTSPTKDNGDQYLQVILDDSSQDSQPETKKEEKKSITEFDLKKILEENDQEFKNNLDEDGFHILDDDQDIENIENKDYEQVGYQNSIFHNSNGFNSQLSLNAQTLKSQFQERVSLITDMIIENVDSNQISKSKLLTLIVSNVLKNEQDEIKQMVMSQLFGQDGEQMDPLKMFDPMNKMSGKDVGQYNLPSYLMTKTRDSGVQTDAVNMIDFYECGIEVTEVFKFDRKAQKLVKYVFSREDDSDLVKQYEYVTKYGKINQYYDKEKLKAAQDPVKLKLLDQGRSLKFEIEKNNKVLTQLLARIRDIEEIVAILERKKEELEQILDKNFKVKDRFIQKFDLFVNSWHKGFVQGFERGMSSGYFKGALENKDFGLQEGFQQGLREGWQFGFDDGFKQGIRRIYKEAKERGLDVSLLNGALQVYLSINEKRQGIQQQLMQRLFRVISFKHLGPAVRGYIEKFNNFNEKKKKHHAKLGLKTVLKFMRLYYQAKIGNKEYSMGEFVFEEFQKKFGHTQMANKGFIQFIASAFYHMKQHLKVDLFCSFLQINEKPFSIDVSNYYITIFEGLQNCKIGLKNEYDEKNERELVSLTKAIEVMREHLEQMLPLEVVLELRRRIEKMKVRSLQGSKQPQIDLDKYMDFMVRNYIKFSVDLINKPQLVYFAWTLYEKNFMGINELHYTVEILSGDKVTMFTEERERIEILQKDILKIFEEQCLEGDMVVVRYGHFSAIMKDSDIFHTKASHKIFAELPFRGTIQKFQSLFEDYSKKFKVLINDIYYVAPNSNNFAIIERFERIDKRKEDWLERLYAIERNIGEVNSTLLLLALILMRETLNFIKKQKDAIIKILWEEKHGKKALANQSAQQQLDDENVLKEQSIKQTIQTKVEEVILHASPVLASKKRSNEEEEELKLKPEIIKVEKILTEETKELTSGAEKKETQQDQLYQNEAESKQGLVSEQKETLVQLEKQNTQKNRNLKFN